MLGKHYDSAEFFSQEFIKRFLARGKLLETRFRKNNFRPRRCCGISNLFSRVDKRSLPVDLIEKKQRSLANYRPKRNKHS